MTPTERSLGRQIHCTGIDGREGGFMKKGTDMQFTGGPDPQQWHHPGGKLRELGAESLSD